MKFDQSKWNVSVDGFYKYRESMINDLMNYHLKKGMTYNQLTELIGKPENISNLKDNTIGFTIMEDYGTDIDPVETKILLVALTTDSLVKDFEIKHWKR